MSIEMSNHVVCFEIPDAHSNLWKPFHSVCMYVCMPLLYAVCLSTLFWMHMTCSAAPHCRYWVSCIEMSQFGTDVPYIFLHWWYTSSPIFHHLLSTATFRFMVSGVLNFVTKLNKCLCCTVKHTHNILNEGLLPSYPWLEHVRPQCEDVRYQCCLATHCFASGFDILVSSVLSCW
jgi:hypothetical protein